MQLIQLCKSRYPENRYDFCILTDERHWLHDGFVIYKPQRNYETALDTSIVQILEDIEC